jgi:hypothetical protein
MPNTSRSREGQGLPAAEDTRPARDVIPLQPAPLQVLYSCLRIAAGWSTGVTVVFRPGEGARCHRCTVCVRPPGLDVCHHHFARRVDRDSARSLACLVGQEEGLAAGVERRPVVGGGFDVRGGGEAPHVVTQALRVHAGE